MLDTALQALKAPLFLAFGSGITLLELVAFVLAVWMVAMNIRVNPLAWPLAILSSLLYFVLFWDSKLYGDASLQLVFIAVAGWGWWEWLNGKRSDGRPLTVQSLGARGRWIAIGAFLVAWPMLGLFLKTFTDTDVPWWDAFPTAGSLIGQWLLGRKYVENWPAWIVVNIVSVGLFAFKGLWLTVILYLIFIAMAAIGWRTWRRLAVT